MVGTLPHSPRPPVEIISPRKVFNDNSRILAVKTSGNVFAAEAVEELNFKAKSWNDLLTGEAFTKRVSGLRVCFSP